MPITVTQKPNPTTSQSLPIYLGFESNRAVLTPHTRSSWRIGLTNNINNGDRLTFDGFSIVFITSPGAYDPYNPEHVDFSNTTDLSVRARRLAAAIQRYEAATVRWEAVPNSPGVGFITLSRTDGIVHTGAVQATDSAGTVLPPTTVTVLVFSAGQEQQRRENWQLIVEPYIETRYMSWRWKRCETLQKPSLIPRNVGGTNQAIEFELQKVLWPFLGYDWPSLTEYTARYMEAFIRRFYVRYTERFTTNAPSSKWQYVTKQSPNPNDPAAPGFGTGPILSETPLNADLFRVVNADFEYIEGLKRNGGVESACIGNSTEYPDPLLPWFGDTPRRWLNTAREKGSFWGAYEFLSFYSTAEDGITPALLTLNYEATTLDGQVVAGSVEGLFDDPLQCFGTNPFPNLPQVYELAWHELWNNVPEDVATVCVWITGATPEEQLYVWGDNGTFEALDTADGGENDTGHNWFADAPPQQGGTGGPDIIINSTLLESYSGTYSMVVSSGSEGNDAGGPSRFWIQPTGTVNLNGGTDYVFTAWVKLSSDFGLEDGFGGVQLGVAAGENAAVSVISEASYLNDRGGPWVKLESVVTPGATGPIQLEIQFTALTALPGIQIAWIDQLELYEIAPELRQITEKFTLNCADPCKEWHTLVFQNALGVPETLHLNGSIQTTWGVEREQAQTIQDYRTMETLERREWLNYNTETVVSNLISVTTAEPPTAFKLPELLKSHYVELVVKDCEPATECYQPLPEEAPDGEAGFACFFFKIASKMLDSSYDFRFRNGAGFSDCDTPPHFYGQGLNATDAMQEFVDTFNGSGFGTAEIMEDGSVYVCLFRFVYILEVGVDPCGDEIKVCETDGIEWEIFPREISCVADSEPPEVVSGALCRDTLLPVLVSSDSFTREDAPTLLTDFEVEVRTSRRMINTQS